LLAARGFYCLGPVAVAGSGGDGNCIVLDCLLFVVAAMLVTSLFRTACACWWWWSLYRFGLFVVGGGSGNVIVCFFVVIVDRGGDGNCIGLDSLLLVAVVTLMS
jgi:hypothetical protein